MRDVNKLNAFFDARLTDETVPVIGYSVAAMENGKMIYQRNGGYQYFDTEHPEKNIPMSAQTRYRIASISKMFTGVAIMQLVDAGKMDLDEAAEKYLGFALKNPNYPNDAITSRMLLSHISSIRNGSDYIFPCGIPLSEVFTEGGQLWEAQRFAGPHDGLDAAPGKLYDYSDLNYVLLAEIIENLSGERYDLYMQDHVLRPLGIRGQFNPGLFSDEEARLLAPTYRRFGNGIFGVDQPWTSQMDDFGDGRPDPNILYYNNPYRMGEPLSRDDISNYRVGTNPSIFLPQGGLRISIEELMKFTQMMLNGGVAVSGERIISEKSAKEMQAPVWRYGVNGVYNERRGTDGAVKKQCYCCGPTIRNSDYSFDIPPVNENARMLIGHTGAANGLKAECWWNPETKTAYAYAYTGLGSNPDRIRGKYGQSSLLLESTSLAICEFLFG